MRKLLIILVFAFFVGMALNSCKTNENCPAYGQIDTELNEENV